MVEHFYVKFVAPSCSGFRDIMPINTQTPVKTLPHDCVGVGNELQCNLQNCTTGPVHKATSVSILC